MTLFCPTSTPTHLKVSIKTFIGYFVLRYRTPYAVIAAEMVELTGNVVPVEEQVG